MKYFACMKYLPCMKYFPCMKYLPCMMPLRRPGMVLLVSLSLTCLTVTAQRDSGAPDPERTDTVTGDTVVVGGEEQSADIVPADSASISGADTSRQMEDVLLPRTVPDSAVRAWKRNPVFAYANDPRYWTTEPPPSSPFAEWLVRALTSKAFQYFIYIVLGALLLYAIYRIVTENQLGLFYRRERKRTAVTEDETGDAAVGEEEIDRRLQEALDSGDYRQAVRFSYLRLLRRLDGRGMIHYHGQSTNQEYIRQLGGTIQEAPFRFLTGAYEKVWYGHFGLSEEAFRRLLTYFTDLDKTLSA